MEILQDVAIYTGITAIACVVIVACIMVGFAYMDRIFHGIVMRVESQARKALSDDIQNCSKWVRYDDDAVLILRAMGVLLSSDCVLYGGALRAEYHRLKKAGKTC